MSSNKPDPMTDKRTHLHVIERALTSEALDGHNSVCKFHQIQAVTINGEPDSCICEYGLDPKLTRRYTNEINPEAAWVAGHTEDCGLEELERWHRNYAHTPAHSTPTKPEQRCTCGHSSVRAVVIDDDGTERDLDWTGELARHGLTTVRYTLCTFPDRRSIRFTCDIPGREAWVDRELMP